MKAWEIEKLSIGSQIPVHFEDDTKELWEEQTGDTEKYWDDAVKIYWGSRVPGSLARDTMAVAAIQAQENRGYKVKDAENLLLSGFRAVTEGDSAALQRATYELFEACRNAEKDPESDFWSYTQYESFAQYAQAVSFPAPVKIDMGKSLEEKIHAGWLSQIVGGAYGTCMEGYTTDNIEKAYNDVRRYVRRPNTYNDDVTYELALLCAYERCGKATSSRDIAYEWLSRISFGWSAEDMALRNLRCGLLPPESGRFNNPFREWIGAQMRGVILGQIYPGNPAKAAEAAWQDAEISHYNSGVLGEVFNALLCSMAFYEKDLRKLAEAAVALMPEDSQYGSVVRFALECCKASSGWLEAWRPCEKKLERYNWVHAFPNAAVEVIALWFGNGDFTDMLEICGRCGRDVDCNAAQIMTLWGTAFGIKDIPPYWTEPIGDRLDTYMRGMKQLSIKKLSKRTADVARLLAEE